MRAVGRFRFPVVMTGTIPLFVLLGACQPQPSGPVADPYDPALMTFGAPPATVTDERHTGAYAEGEALSMTAKLEPLADGDVKTVRIDTTHRIVEIAPGVRFSAWTFGDQVPGPTVRAKVGDRIRFSMTNRSDEVVPGVRLTSAPMMHSMDFHSAMVARTTSTARSRRDRPSSSSSRRTIRACTCTTAVRRWCSNTSRRACTA